MSTVSSEHGSRRLDRFHKESYIQIISELYRSRHHVGTPGLAERFEFRMKYCMERSLGKTRGTRLTTNSCANKLF